MRELETAFQEAWPVMVASLVRRFRDLDIAEEAAGEAVAAAVSSWETDGVPPNPVGWLMTTATRKAIDRVRRESQRDAKHTEALRLFVPKEVSGPVARERIATGEAPGRYQLQAAIGAVHCAAPEFRATDWSQIVQLYDQLAVLDPSPVVLLNRAVAIGEVDGPGVALALVDRLPLEGYHAWHATRAELLRRLGRSAAAAQEYEAALEATANPAQRRYLARRRGQLSGR